MQKTPNLKSITGHYIGLLEDFIIFIVKKGVKKDHLLNFILELSLSRLRKKQVSEISIKSVFGHLKSDKKRGKKKTILDSESSKFSCSKKG